ncbi:MAG: DUF362 domain-containing protein [Oscillospiraceae bacterium]|nr:DUF362 domain-containing protein [Oscillospiraceae bacterium]
MSKKRKKILITLAAVILVLAVLAVIYAVHMRYDQDVHENYNIKVMEGEGRSYGDYSTVYFTKDITPEGLERAYEALGRVPGGKVGVKLSTGEAGNPNYLSPDLIKDLVQSLDGTIIECNTAYGGSKRAETAMHMQVAKEHGFTDIADVDIMDKDGYMVIPVEGGTLLRENWVGKDLADYDFIVVLSHFKGHPMGGFGGALKNISIGIASSEGKVRIHSAGLLRRPPITLGAYITNQNDFTGSMAEAAKSVSDYEGHGEKMLYISVMNHISVDCDCVSAPAEVDMHDIGILASLDPVALDQACVDLIYDAPDGQSMRDRIERQNGIHILAHAEEIGFGNRAYELVDIDGGSDE